MTYGKVSRAFGVHNVAKGAQTQRNVVPIGQALYKLCSDRYSIPVKQIECHGMASVEVHFWAINMHQIRSLCVKLCWVP